MGKENNCRTLIHLSEVIMVREELILTCNAYITPFTLAVLSKQVAIPVFFIPLVDYIWFLCLKENNRKLQKFFGL